MRIRFCLGRRCFGQLHGAAVNIETYALVHHKVKLAESRAVISEEQASLERQRVVTAISETYAP